MEYIVDSLLKALEFDEVAKIVSSSIEESFKNFTDEIQETVRETTDVVMDGLGKGISRFGVAFKETGVQAFEDWGHSIERGFCDVGEKVESGIIKGVDKLANSIEVTTDQVSYKVSSAIENTVRGFTEGIADFGVEQAPEWKRTYHRELTVFCICIVLVSVGIFLLTLAHALKSSNALTTLITEVLFSTKFVLLLLAFFSGYLIFMWSKTAHNTYAATGSSCALTPNDFSVDNPKMRFGIASCIGFLLGHICGGLSFTVLCTLNATIVIITLVVLTVLVFKIFSLETFYNIYATWRQLHEFQEFMIQRKRQQQQQQQQQQEQHIFGGGATTPGSANGGNDTTSSVYSSSASSSAASTPRFRGATRDQ